MSLILIDNSFEKIEIIKETSLVSTQIAVNEIDISKLWIDESIQVSRDLVLVDKILKKFDPRKSLPIDCVKELNEDKYYIIDGQHRVIVFGLLGIRKIQVNIQSEEKIEDYYEDEKKILVDEIKGNNDDEWNEKNIIS